MADFADDVPYTDAATAVSQGKRHLLVRDYTAAVTAFAEGLELLSRKYGDFGDELGEPYLLYGRALLGLARTESGVLGNGVLGSDETENDEGNEDKDDTSSSIDDKEEDRKLEDETENVTNKKDTKYCTTDNLNSGSAETVENNCNKGESLNKNELMTELANNIPGSSKEKLEDNAKTLKTNQDENTLIENEDDNAQDDEDEPGRGIDLQVAWEVLELAKNVFSKRGPSGYKYLAEAYRLLGEVAMESGNHQVAVTDLKQSLKILQILEPYEFRAIAELHYQLGLAYSLVNDFDTSIEQFNEAMNLLQSRIKQLEATQDIPLSDDPFYSIQGEITELKELLPEIQEKITDIKDFKREACQLVINGLKNKITDHINDTGSNSNITPSPVDSSSSKELKPASDISHLVRKKRRAETSETQNTLPCKKNTIMEKTNL